MKKQHFRVISHLLIALTSPVVHAADMDQLRSKCESYGAVPGTTAFVDCMRQLDEQAQKEEQYQQELKQCDALNGLDLFSRCMNACNVPGNPGFCLQFANQCVADFPARCKLVVDQRYGKIPPSNRRVCQQINNQIVCEDR
jgi:hypothetical protein